MKLRNKKTGEIIDGYKGQVLLHYHYDNGRKTIHFKPLEELEEWEDYEEPKGYYFIDINGRVKRTDLCFVWLTQMKEIGNYFETKEEAKKAVEKLKALKRLKDNGFEFTGWKRDKKYCGDFTITAADQTSCDDEDLDLLFGGEA